ncbi:MAG: DNA mismatch repair protein MutS [bacterium]
MDNTTPAEKQYLELKNKYKDCVLLFRMGDFYETFDDDARLMSKILGLTLTSRSKGSSKRPLAGIPHHALHTYLGKIVNAGFKVAIADQMEDPKFAKGIVKRDVVRVVTSGTLIDDKNLPPETNNYIVSVFSKIQKAQTHWGLSWIDLSTGEFKITEAVTSGDDPTIPSKILDIIKSVSPREILTTQSLKTFLSSLLNVSVKVVEDFQFDYKPSLDILKDQFRVQNLKGFGVEEYMYGIGSAGALVTYLKNLQRSEIYHINGLSYENLDEFMNLDFNTIRNLELLSPTSPLGNPKSTLIGILDRTSTPGGKRLIRNFILRPLIDKSKIEKRLNVVKSFYDNFETANSIKLELDKIYDIERIAGRLGINNISPKDFLALKQSLDALVEIVHIASDTSKPMYSKSISELDLLKDLFSKISMIEQIKESIVSTIKEDAPFDVNQTGVFVDGFNSELDELRVIRHGGGKWMSEYERKLVIDTSINTLKVRFNNVFGYYIEVSKGMISKVPSSFTRKQTLVNAERYVTDELKEMEVKVLSAEDKILTLEKSLYEEFKTGFVKYIPILQGLSKIISNLDVLLSFSVVAKENNYVYPEILVDIESEDGNESKKDQKILKISEGRHPVVEKILKSDFITNDIELSSEKYVIILTGPNMSGKSTYIRQIALITLMAQIGSFVPAKSAKLSLVDRVFTRIGASDNLAEGESTFMVEMNETANILNNATSKSLVILDEVGRGTSTFDGVAIAWSVVKYIHDNLKCRTLFATHYNELTKLSDRFDGISNYNVEVSESNGEVAFLHKISPGAAHKSFGVHVAKLAGLPKEVVENATKILKDFESSKGESVKRKMVGKLESPHTPQIGLGL